MRTSWVLFFALVFTLCKCWKYVPLASTVAQWIGFIVVVSSLSYWLTRYIWTVAFVSLVSAEGKAVLVTGCDSGFGYYLVKSLSRIGFFVFAGCLDANSDGANDLRTLDNVKVLQMDISSEEQVNDAVATIKVGLGSKVLWAVVCNAGMRNEGLLEWIPMDALKRVIDVNIIGNCRVSKAFLPVLRKARGRLVVVTSSFGNAQVLRNHADGNSILDDKARSCVHGRWTSPGVLWQGSRHHLGYASSLQDEHHSSFVFATTHDGRPEAKLPRGRRRLHAGGNRRLDTFLQGLFRRPQQG
ncbi:17-beta-hydroxysteroid dehydrogenase type 2 isoform X2 [Rhipicephalus microplus]|uniref:17-beta-hydroxysteroid dehydrogenase type 2 isoform X2 n=1 Tax=Rhipicephalus microplus TaxID=6941 RepID=UPI003F6CB54C